jgi:hypothetical protein
MVTVFFLQLMTTQFRTFVSIFSPPAHDVCLRTLLASENGSLVFVPSYRDLTILFQEHFGIRLSSFGCSFVRLRLI